MAEVEFAILGAGALATLRHADIGVAFSIQNGMMKDELLADVFGRQRVLGSLVNASGELLGSGEVLFSRNANVFAPIPRFSVSSRPSSELRLA